MKILNLYAGIGGNRKLWGDEHEITALEHDEKIAAIYQASFPKDKVVIGDAHDFLLKNYRDFDFIWSSPPCPSHSRTNTFLNSQGIVRYPDMKLWQEIIFLQSWFKGKWCVENVISYYPPLYPPSKILDRHYFWGNFIIKHFTTGRRRPTKDDVDDLEEWHGFKLGDVPNRRLMLRNCVYPPLGKHILDCATKQFHYPAMPLFT